MCLATITCLVERDYFTGLPTQHLCLIRNHKTLGNIDYASHPYIVKEVEDLRKKILDAVTTSGRCFLETPLGRYYTHTEDDLRLGGTGANRISYRIQLEKKDVLSVLLLQVIPHPSHLSQEPMDPVCCCRPIPCTIS
ncbi:MAG: hypothetical protein JSS61_03145 [Verrucomicrobia bacterium]|nr:hypothetical protein [Verrucomicrobiota bacterium]